MKIPRISILLLLSCTSCITSSRSGERAPAGVENFAETPRSARQWLDQSTKASFQVTSQKLDPKKSFRGCRAFDVTFESVDPVHQRPNKIRLKYFVPQDATEVETAAVIIMPPINGANALDSLMSKSLCQANIRSAILVDFGATEDEVMDFKTHDHQTLRALAAIKQTADFLKTRQLGILGTSLGSLYSVLALSYDLRFKAAVFIVAGVNLPGILTYSNQSSVVKQRQTRMKNLGLTSQEVYELRLQDNIILDPGSLLAETDLSRPVKMYIALKDKTIPAAYQELLFDQLKAAEKTEFKQGHATTIFRTFMTQKKEMTDFFKRSLE